MPSSYTQNNGLVIPATGENNNTWGDLWSNSGTHLIDTALDGVVSVTLTGSTHSLAITDGAASDGRNRVLLFSGSPGANCTVTVTPNDAEKWYFVYNGTSGGFSVIMAQGGGSGSTVTVANGYWALVRMDGTGSNANVTRLLDSWEVTTAIKAATHTSAAALTIKPGTDSTSGVVVQTSAAANVIRVDTTNKRVSLGTATATPGATVVVSNNATNPSPVVSDGLHVVGADAGTPRIEIDAFGTGVGAGVICRAAVGTAASPSAVQSSTSLGQYGGRGYLTTGYSNNLASVEISSEENYTDSTAKTGIGFRVTNTGSVTSAERMRLNGAGQLELSATTGALLLNRLTTTQRDALTPTNGMVIYNSTTNKFQGYQAGAWVDFV